MVRDTFVIIRVSPTEKQEIKRLAEHIGKTMSDLLRQPVLQTVKSMSEVKNDERKSA